MMTDPGRPPDFLSLARRFAAGLTAAHRTDLALRLGVPERSFAALPLMGYDTARAAWTFPELGGGERVVGLVRLRADGLARPAAGGRRGLTVPAGWCEAAGPLFVVEGPLEVLALAAAGLTGVGRPSGGGAVRRLCGLLAGLPADRPVTVVGAFDPRPDGSWPGRDGAAALAGRLADALHRPVGWAVSPGRAENLRSWLRVRRPRSDDDWRAAGAALAQALADAANPVRPGGAADAAAVCVADLAEGPVEWLMPGWLARGAVTVLDGDPGLGKSTLTLDLAARVSQGWRLPPAPAGEPDPGRADRGVLLLTAEDAAAQTVKPRLRLAGADQTRVQLWQPGGPADAVRFPDGLAALEALVRRHRAALVVIDPLMAFLGHGVNAHSDADVRRVLGGFHRVAQATGAAVLVVRHLTKASRRSVLYRGGGSVGIIAAARTGWLLAAHPDDPGRRVLAATKGNLSAAPRSLVFRLEPVESWLRLAWEGECDLTAEILLCDDPADDGPGWTGAVERQPGRLQLCIDVVRTELVDGPLPAAELQTRLADAGFRPGTIRRACAVVGVRRWRRVGTWVCSLPAEGAGGG
jgi:hypothetical protein